MLPFQNYWRPSSTLVNLMDGGDSLISSASKVDTGRSSTEPPCKSHKEAERKRRQRINAHLSTLRSLLPHTTKTDKASLLAEVVSHVRELRKKVADVAGRDADVRYADGRGSEPDSWPFPSEFDEATMSYCEGEGRLLKATLCCEDRPGLTRDLTRAIRSVPAKAVRAEMTTVGGRTKNVVEVQLGGDGGGDGDVRALKRALKAVVENRAAGSGLGQFVSGNKRARVYGSFNESDYELLLTNI